MGKQHNSSTAIQFGKQEMKEPPEVSIIILNFNGRSHLELCLPSVMEIDYPKDKLEIIVVDNASEDDSIDWLRQKYPKVRLLENLENLGFARGINSGVEIARGTYVAFLNPDMRVDKKWLSALIKTMKSKAGAVCSGSIVLNWNGNKVDYSGRPNDALNLCPEMPVSAQQVLKSAKDCPLLFASGGAMLIDREIFLRLGGFDKDYFLYHEDVDLGWRLWIRGHKVLRSAESIVYHRGGASSKQLSPEFVYRMAQRYALYTLLKNLEDTHLWSILTGVLWLLVERTRWFDAARLSLENAIHDFTQDIETALSKRASIQSERALSDEEIFAECGYPFGFISSNKKYQRFVQYLADNEDMLYPSIIDVNSISHHITRLLYHAYKFNFEGIANEPSAATQDRHVLLLTKMQKAAQMFIPSAWRCYFRPLWRLVTNRVTRCRESTEQKVALDGSVLSILKYIGNHFDRFGRVPYLIGRCNICGKFTTFFCPDRAHYRESLNCAECLTTSRYRSLAQGILRAVNDLTGVKVKSIADLALSGGYAPLKIYDTQVPFYTETNAYPIPDLLSKCKWIEVQKSIYLPQQQLGSHIAPDITNQNLEGLTFLDNTFDIVITSDVMEHVRLDDKAHREIRRILKPDGVYCFTVPHFRDKRETMVRVAVTDASDPAKDLFVMDKEYHGDANSAEGAALSYRTYGTDLDEKLRELGFTVDYSNRDCPEMGIMMSELFYCRLSK